MKFFSQRIIINVVFLFVLLILILFEVFSYRQIQQLLIARKWVYHTHIVIEKTDQVLISTIEAESQVYYYLFAHNPQMITAIIDKFRVINNNLVQLKQLTKDNTSQQMRLTNVENLLNIQKQLFQQIVLEYSKNTKNIAQLPITKSYQSLSEKIKKILISTTNAEIALLIDRNKGFVKEENVTNFITIALGIFSILLFFSSLLLLNYYLYQRELAESNRLVMDNRLLVMNQQLKENADRYELAAAGSNAGLADWNIKTGEVYYSSNLKHLLGYLDSEFPAVLSSFENNLHPDDRDMALTQIKQHLENHIPFNVEYRLMNKEGDYQWFLAIAQAKWDEKGAPLRMVSSLIDITERKKQDVARNLSTPVLEFSKELLILPIIGDIDAQRANQITKQLLTKVQETRAKVIVVDITGVPTVDSKVAKHLIQTVDATRLMGAKLIITGLSTSVSATLVRMGIDLKKVTTTSNLQSGIQAAFEIINSLSIK